MSVRVWIAAGVVQLLVPSIAGCGVAADIPRSPALDLRPTLAPSGVHDLAGGDVVICGRVLDEAGERVRLRVTTLDAQVHETSADVRDGVFTAAYPADFPGAPQLVPTIIFVDATTTPDWSVSVERGLPAEVAVIVCDLSADKLPDLPSAFTNDLYDEAGRTDQKAAEWPVIRTLVNRYMRSRAARLAEVGGANFDLAGPEDMATFKNEAALYDFDHRDRDWSTPLNHRVARTFWQAVWDQWFNSSNNNPLDGDDSNQAPDNFCPYAFANDFSDVLITYLMRLDLDRAMDDNLTTMCREGLENVLAMQHRGRDTFAQRDTKGRRHTYTAGAFRYGMFVNGQYMTEGTGWFYNPAFEDYIDGGVFNGRATWALGEGLRRMPDGPLAGRLREAIACSVRFCLSDAIEHGYAHRTPGGHVWWRDIGEHGYLLLGMLAACEVSPDLVVVERSEGPATLRDFCADGLDALVELVQPRGQWSLYADHDGIALAAMADGVRVLHDHPGADAWKRTAVAVADSWVQAPVDRKAHPGPIVHFAERLDDGRMSFLWGPEPGRGERNFIFFYKTGHWLHALAKMYRITGEMRYRARCERIVRYLCGDNPFQVRVLSEHGGVYNWVEDEDGDGIEDALKFDMYPESTAFCHIGLWHVLRAIAEADNAPRVGPESRKTK